MFIQPVPYHLDEGGKKRFYLDPTRPISINFCSECWTFLPDDSCICEVCGYTCGVFETYGNRVCNLCGERIGLGTAKEIKGGLINPYPSYQCENCLRKQASITEALKNTLNSDKCKRHRDIHTQFACNKCGKHTCQYCTYHLVKGIFKKSVLSEPYCFSCVRNELHDGPISTAILNVYRRRCAEKKYLFKEKIF